MLKKMMLSILLSFLVSVAYADAAVNLTVTKAVSNEPFNINEDKWGYEFRNGTGKTLFFYVTVDEKSVGAVNFQCWHGQKSERYNVNPGETSNACVTDDLIRVVPEARFSYKIRPALGTYTIKVQP